MGHPRFKIMQNRKMGVTCSTRRSTMEKDTMVPYGKSDKSAHSSEVYVIERLRAKEDYYSHDKDQDDQEDTISDSDVDDQYLAGVDHKGVNQLDHKHVGPSDQKSVDQVDYDSSQVVNIDCQDANSDHKVISNLDDQATALHNHRRVTQTDTVKQAIVADQQTYQRTAEATSTIVHSVNDPTQSMAAAALVLTIEEVSPEPPNEIVLRWSKSQLLDSVGCQLELNGRSCGDVLPSDMSCVNITLQPGMLHLLALRLLPPDSTADDAAAVTSESVQLFIPKLSPIPQMSEISINMIGSVAVVVNVELNIRELIPPSLISEESFASVCLLSAYSLVLTFLCNERFVGDVEISCDHINITESQSCIVEIKCFIGGCLPKIRYNLHCGLTLKARSLPDSSVTLPSVTGRMSNVLEITCPSPPEASSPVIVGCDYEGIHLEWDEAHVYGTAAISGYRLLVNGQQSGDVLPTNTTNMVFSDCELGMFYQFRVVALTDHISGSSGHDGAKKTSFSVISFDDQKTTWSGLVDYQNCVPSQGVAVRYSGFVLAVTELEVEAVNTRCANVWWKAPPITENVVAPVCFKLKCSEQANESSSVTHVQTALPNKEIYDHQFHNLTPNTSYSVIMEAMLDDDDSSAIGMFARSQKRYFTTLSLPTPPHNLQTFPKLQSVIINWEPSTGQIAGYVMEIREKDSPLGRRFVLKKDSTSCGVTQLKPDMCYEISICAAYSEKVTGEVDDDLSYTDTVMSYCAPLGPISTSDLLQVSIFNCQCLHLEWSLPNITASEQLQYCTVLCKEGTTLFPSESDWMMNINKDDKFILRQQFPSTITSYNIINLSPNHCYSCAVVYSIAAKHDQTTIPYDSSVYVVTTKHILSDVITTRVAPLAPTLLLSAVGRDIVLKWLPPHGDLPDTIIIGGYLLKVNGMEYQLDSYTTKHTIQNCSPGNEYSISVQAKTAHSEEWNVSQPDRLSVSLPAVDNTGFHTLSCSYVTINGSGGKPVKMIAISWDFKLLQEEIVTVKSFVIEWQCLPGSKPGRIVQSSSSNGCDITNPLLRAIYVITVTALLSDGSNIKSTPLKYQIPSPPDSVLVSLEVVKSNYFTVNWTEPQQYGGLAIKGYQAVLDNKRIGNILDVSCVSAKIPRRRQKAHTFTLLAITADENPDNYSTSNTLKIPAEQAASPSSTKTPHIDIVHVEAKSTGVEISWKLHDINVSQHQSVIIQWSSASSPKMRSEIAAIGTHRNGSHTITCCKPGIVHFIKVVCTGRHNQTIAKSRLVKVTTSSPPEQPVITASYATSSITVQWKRPVEYGNDRIVHYKLQVNDSEHIIDNVATSFELHSCVPCHLYQFSLQAITAESCSKPSEVVAVRCPGIQFGAMAQLSSGKLDCILCRWDVPEIHGYQVHHFNIYCRPEAEFSDKCMSFDLHTITHGPLQPSTTKHCFSGLKKTSLYLVMLEAVTDSENVFQGTPHHMATAILPMVTITQCDIVEMKERAELEEKLCSAVMQRESTCLQLYWHATRRVSSRSPSRHADSIATLSWQLLDCEKKISKMLTLLEQRNAVAAKVKICWQLSEHSSTNEVELSGYEVFVDGKHWSRVPHTCTTSIIKLDYSKQLHCVAVKPLTGHCIGDGDLSRPVEISTDQFTSFSLFCFGDVHSRNASWPDHDCCAYQNTFSQETTLDPMTRQPISTYYQHNRLLGNCSVVDVFSGHVDNLLPTPPHNKPVVILFWTEWCTASADAIKLFIKLSNNHRHTYKHVTCCTGSRQQESHLRRVQEMISRNVALLSNEELPAAQMQHFCACSNTDQVHCGTHYHPEAIFNVIGVPTITIIHPNGYVAWQGRFFNKMFNQYNKEFLHTIHIAMSQACPVNGCTLCYQAAYDLHHTLKNAQMGGFSLGVYGNKLSY